MATMAALVIGLNENCDGLLAQCLRALHYMKGVEQFIFVDGGSTDGTVDVAKQNNFDVVYFPWNHNHAASRNAGLEQVRCDWVVVTDPDELWSDWYNERLASYLSEPPAFDSMLVPLHNFLGDPFTVHERWENVQVRRVFRRGVKYTGAIHERPDTEGWSRCVANEYLYHYGWARGRRYLEMKMGRRCKHENRVINLDLLLTEGKPFMGLHPQTFNPNSLVMKPEWLASSYFDVEFNPV